MEICNFGAREFTNAIPNCYIPNEVAEKLASYCHNKFMKWLENNTTKLYGRKDDKDGWEFHEKPGDFDTHTMRGFGIEPTKESLSLNWKNLG